MKKTRNHDESVITMLQNDAEFASEYLHAAFEELDEEGGETAFLTALRHIVEARGGIAEIAKKAGLSRESLYRALSANGNPTLSTMKKVVNATGLSFAAIS
jgi:probable addiction module antidote protein